MTAITNTSYLSISRNDVPEVSACCPRSPCSLLIDDTKGKGFASLRLDEGEVVQDTPKYSRPSATAPKFPPASKDVMASKFPPRSKRYLGRPIPFNLPQKKTTSNATLSNQEPMDFEDSNMSNPKTKQLLDFADLHMPNSKAKQQPGELPFVLTWDQFVSSNMSICTSSLSESENYPHGSPGSPMQICEPSPAPLDLGCIGSPMQICELSPVKRAPSTPSTASLSPPWSPLMPVNNRCVTPPTKQNAPNTAALFISQPSPLLSPPGAWLEELRELGRYDGPTHIERMAKNLGISVEEALEKHGHWIIDMKI